MNINQLVERIIFSIKRRDFEGLEYYFDRLSRLIKDKDLDGYEQKNLKQGFKRIVNYSRHSPIPLHFSNKIKEFLKRINKGFKKDDERIFDKSLERVKQIEFKKDDLIIFFLGAGASIPPHQIYQV